MALAASSAFAVTDGATYETIDGLECKNLWIADRFHNNYDFARYSFMEMGTKARTACIAKLGETNEDIKILVGWSPTITEGETSNDYAKIVVINSLPVRKSALSNVHTKASPSPASSVPTRSAATLSATYGLPVIFPPLSRQQEKVRQLR